MDNSISNVELANWLNSLIDEIGSNEERYGRLWDYHQALDEIEERLRKNVTENYAEWVDSEVKGYLCCSHCKNCNIPKELKGEDRFKYCPECGYKMR